jgi:hypothetical protein|tara:strand:- start:5763 stop:6398 length:636 start_codon:yes stop_codon:yes gene_type:complete
MSSNSTHFPDNPTGGDAATPAHQSSPQEAFPGLPQEVVVTHILRSDTDPIVLARLRAVSHAMRDAVNATGISVGQMNTVQAARSGYLDTFKHMLQKGRLNKSVVCKFAALGGQLEVLQWARANGFCRWNEDTCMRAAMNGHLMVIQWLHANGCPWDVYTCGTAAEGGYLEALQWLRANGCPWIWRIYEAVATRAQHVDVAAWVREHKTTMP